MIKDDKNKKDKELQEAGVKFLPFVGDNYEDGISFDKDGKLVLEGQGKKVLVLGESHYCDEDLSDEKLSSFPRDVLGRYLGSEERDSWMRTFVKFERALANADTKIDSESIWNHLMFYNYLQRPLRGTRMASEKNYEEAKNPFFAILEKYKPDYIIVWGRRLFAKLPNEKGEYMSCNDMNLWSYNIEGKMIKVLPIYHPSVGFSWDYWHKVIVVFIK